MNITPTPWTAALAGIVAGLAWPWLWARFGGPGASGTMELVMATLLLIALPAHALVIGFGRGLGSGGSDRALLVRVGAWLGAGLLAAGAAALATGAGTP